MRPVQDRERVLLKRLPECRACAPRQGITIADCSRPDMPLIYANDAFTRITGYQLDETLGKNCRFLQARAPGALSWPACRARLQAHAELGLPGAPHGRGRPPRLTDSPATAVHRCWHLRPTASTRSQ
jgi:PAS domain-containing protein